VFTEVGNIPEIMSQNDVSAASGRDHSFLADTIAQSQGLWLRMLIEY
jgi:hypothetical protein